MLDVANAEILFPTNREVSSLIQRVNYLTPANILIICFHIGQLCLRQNPW